MYGQPAAGGGSVYGQKASFWGNSGAPASKSGGGILGALGDAGHWIASKAALAGHDIAAIPGGTYDLFKPIPVAAYDVARYGPNDAWGGAKGAAAEAAVTADANRQTRGVVKNVVHQAEHPLADPFATALTFAPAAHLPLRLGEVARGVDITAPRTLTMGEKEVPLPSTSGNALVRTAQRGYAGLLQHALDTNPEGRLAAHAASRIGGSLQETARYQARMSAVPADLLDQAGRELRGNIGKHIPFSNAKAAQAALRLTSENSTPEEAAVFHRAMVANDVAPAANAKLADLYDHIAKSEMLTRDEHGNVSVNAEKFPKLAAADAALARAQAEGERIVTEHGLMTPEGQQARVDLPGQIRRTSIDEPNLPTSTLAGRSTAWLQNRAAQIDADYERLREQAMGGKPGDYKSVTAIQNGRLGKYDIPTVREQLLSHADQAIEDTMRAHPDHPAVQALQAKLAEGHAIKTELAARNDVALGIGEEHAPQPLNRERSIYGPSGRGYVPYRLTEPRATRNDIARASSSVVGKARSPIGAHEFTGAGLERGLVPDNTTGLVARNLRRLYRYVNTDQFRRQVLQTGADTRRTSRDILVRLPDEQAGKIPLSIERDLGRKKITLDELEGHRQAIADHVRNLIPGYNPDAFKPSERFRDANSEAARYGIGEAAPKGYRWVDRNALGDVGNAFSFSRGGAGRFADNVNSATTMATVYLKPGHFPTRVFTNAATNLIQGSAGPIQIAKTVRLWRALSHEDRLRSLAAAGQPGYEAMPHEGAGFVGRSATKGAHWWAKHADAPFRFASLAYEARKAGYSDASSFRRFMHVLENPDRFPKDEALRADAVQKEANRAAIAYDRLSDTERRTIGRAIWFYPFLRSSALYTGRALLNHPYKSSLLAQAGVTGRERQQSILGDLPSYESGLIPLGGNKVTDVSRLDPFSAATDILQSPEYGVPRNYLNPAYGALVDLLTRTNSLGQHSKTPLSDAASELFSPTPEAQILTALLHRNQDQSKRMFPKNPAWAGTHDPVLRALIGAATPRTFNPNAAHSAAARERAGR